MDHRDLHGSVSKVGKAIDRNFTADFTSITRHDLFQNERNIKLLDKNIAQHFFRQGITDVAESLLVEASLPKDELREEPFAELHKIYEEIHQRNLNSAIEWAARFSNELEARNSSLEFKLHRLAFLQIIGSGVTAQNEAISYARRNLTKFVTKYQKDFQALMGSLLYLKVGLTNSPYKYLLRDDMWIEAADVFLKDSSIISGINPDSPLTVIINAGCKSLPALLNLKQVMSRQVQGIWSGRDELPVSLHMTQKRNLFHLLFSLRLKLKSIATTQFSLVLFCGNNPQMRILQ